MFKSKLTHKAGMLILALIIVILGTSIIDKKFHLFTKLSNLPGQIAGVFIQNTPPNKFLDGIGGASIVGAQATAPYQNVSGDVAISGKVGIVGTVTAPTFTGTLNGAAPWGSVSGRPGWLNGGSYVENHNDANALVNSGFYENGGCGTNWPSCTWYNSLTVRHSNQGNGHGFMIAMSYYDNNLWFRSFQGGLSPTYQPWVRAVSADSSGRVGIGTVNPTAMLDVNGSTRTLGSDIFAQSDNGSTSYSVAPIQIREALYGASGSYLPPRLSFHWGGVVASQIGIESSGAIAILNNPGTGYEQFKAGSITANGNIYNSGGSMIFSTTTGTHTGYGNNPGWAAIENAASYNTLMILGRSNGIGGVRSVSIWDRLDVNGTLAVTGTKNFEIPHPTKPGYKLIHSSLEGPEAAVFYRGEGQLKAGEVEIVLPDYFEALTRPENRTVTLTAKGKTPYLLSTEDIKNGRFKVYGTQQDGRFFWEVKAVRNDVAPIEVEKPNEK